MAISPFTWGAGGQKASPSSVKKYADIAAALAAKSGAPKNLGEGLNRVGEALLANSYSSRAETGEAEGAAARKAVMDALMSNPDASMSDYAGALGNEWVSNDPGSSAIVQAMMGQEMQSNDPLRQMQLQQAQQGLDMGALELENARNPQPAAPDYGFTQLDDGTFVRTDTTSGTFEPLGQFAKPESGPLVEVNTGDNSSAFTKKADELAAVRIGDVITAGQGASQMMGDIQTLAALGSQIDTGMGAEIMNTLGPYAQALGVDIQGLSEGQAYKSIIDRMAPGMRPVGSGSSSDTDVRMFLNSLPSLGKTPEGNTIIMQTLSGLQEHKMAAAQIAELATMPEEAGGISWQEAEKRIRELPNPYEGFNNYKPQGDAALGAAAAQNTAAQAGADWNAPQPPQGWSGPADKWQWMSPEARALWN